MSRETHDVIEWNGLLDLPAWAQAAVDAHPFARHAWARGFRVLVARVGDEVRCATDDDEEPLGVVELVRWVAEESRRLALAEAGVLTGADAEAVLRQLDQGCDADEARRRCDAARRAVARMQRPGGAP